MASEIRVNKIENRSGLGTVTFADTGVDLAGIVTATTFSGSGASLTALPAAQLSGALPAISAASLTNVPAANVVGVHTSLTVTNATTTGTAIVGGGVTISESGIEASGIGITCANINGAQVGGRRNKIINGAMTINQRAHTGAVGHNAYGLDRWKYNRSANAEFNIEQSTETPDGFAKSLQVDCTTASGSVGSSDYARLRYHLEGQDLQDFAKGTSSAKKFALSFYAKSSVTGDYCIAFEDGDNNRMVTTTYTVSNTNWNRYEISIPADATGAFDNDANGSLTIWWWLISGSGFQAGSAQTTWGAYAENALGKGHTANLGSSTSNNFYLTGVQLEVGSQATAFEHRSYTEDLRLCQRYFQFIGSGFCAAARGGSSSLYIYSYTCPVNLRASPTISTSDTIAHGTFSIRRYRDSAATSDSTNTPATNSSLFQLNNNTIRLQQDGFSAVDDRSATIYISGGAITLSSEL